jgi:hypothetical protein
MASGTAGLLLPKKRPTASAFQIGPKAVAFLLHILNERSPVAGAYDLDLLVEAS